MVMDLIQLIVQHAIQDVIVVLQMMIQLKDALILKMDIIYNGKVLQLYSLESVFMKIALLVMAHSFMTALYGRVSF
jgi:hypothetical protein